MGSDSNLPLGQPSPIPVEKPAEPEDLVELEYRWTTDLKRSAGAEERLEVFLDGAANATRPRRNEGRFTLTWLRSLADDVEAGRLQIPLPERLVRAADAAFTILLEADLDSLQLARDLEPIDLLKENPSAFKRLRAVSHIAASLRSTGVLDRQAVDVLEFLVSFSRSVQRSARRSVPAVPEGLRITRDDLKSWTGAANDLPELVRRLILETAYDLSAVHFPAGTGTAVGGWDGEVVAGERSLFVPEGRSVWELSVSQQPHRKAEADYAKRRPLADANTTYVALSLATWTKRAEFSKTHEQDGDWGAVRAYNVDDLETWLSQAPMTSVWLAEQIHGPVSGLQTITRWWQGWLASTIAPLDERIVLAGRESAVKDLAERLRSPGITTIGGEVRQEEVYAFVAAAVSQWSRGGELREMLLVDNEDQLQRLLRRPGPVTVLTGLTATVHKIPVTAEQRILVAAPGGDRADVVLPPISPGPVAEVLELEPELALAARDLAALGRRSLLALRRHLAIHPELHIPGWAKAADVVRRRTLLINGWNEASEGDRDAIADFIGMPYDGIRDALVKLADERTDPMVAAIDQRWHLVAPSDSWRLLGPQLTGEDVRLFNTLVDRVLLERDPLAHLNTDDRLRASLRGERKRYSGELSRGLARSLALLGSADDLTTDSMKVTPGAASHIVAQLLEKVQGDISGSSWHAILPHLPLFSEAAPDVVLRELEEMLSGSSPIVREIWSETDRGVSSHSQHTHVLWTLETLAWSELHFDRAMDLLATLAEVDPGGSLANRPSASLSAILCLWHPNTSATAEHRQAVVARLRRSHPTVAWQLLLDLVPSDRGFHMIHQGPRYRPWKAEEPRITHAEMVDGVRWVAGALLEDVGTNPGRWTELVGTYAELPPDERDRIRVRLRRLAELGQLDGDATELWNKMRELVARHREYSDAGWALPATEVDELESIATRLAPPQVGHRHAWLFAEHFVTLGDIHRRDNFQEYEDELARRRDAALDEIVSDGGLDAVIGFADEAGTPPLVGVSLARVGGDSYSDALLPLLKAEEPGRLDFAFAYFGQLFRESGWEWLDSFMDGRTMTPVEAARLLRTSWAPLEGGQRADRLGPEVSLAYWSEVQYFGLGGDFKGALDLARRLMEHDRTAAALDLLAIYARTERNDPEYALGILVAFEMLMAQQEDAELQRLSQHDVDSLLQILSAHQTDLGRERLARVEWFFLPMLGYEPDARVLHRTLADDPSFFVEIVSLVFRSQDDDSESSPSESDRMAAANAYRLLSSWSICPGTVDDGTIDSERLRTWVAQARSALIESGRGRIGDEQIGQALAASPADEDGLWPVRPIRELLEELHSDTIDNGLGIRLLNNRGATFRSLDEGGRMEWELAAKHRKQADELLPRWPRASRIHRGLAESYEADARREDAQAERHRRGLDY